MFTHILVPLDGSKLAETALTPAVSLAETLHAPLTLLHVVEKNAPREVHSDHHLTSEEEAQTYLRGVIADYATRAQINAHVHSAHVKNVAASIIEHVQIEFKPDLVVMCTHGSSGVRNLLFGSIALQVVAGGKTPLLLLQPENSQPRPFNPRRILVPLDSESEHDEGLRYALELARAYQSELYLLTVIPTLETLTGQEAAISAMLPATAMAYLDLQEENARAHLQTHLNDFSSSGENVRAEIGRGDAVSVIIETAARVKADLILLSTHHRAGMKAFWARSVAPNVVKKTRLPVLLIPLNRS